MLETMENYFEIKRKLIHILIGILLLFAIFYNILTPLILAIIILHGAYNNLKEKTHFLQKGF